MKKSLCSIIILGLFGLGACSSTESTQQETTVKEVSPRQGEEVKRVCNIDGWGQVEGDGKALIVYNSRREAFKLSMIGLCDADWAMSRILIDGNSGANCVGRGSKIATDANFSRSGICTVMKVHQWLPPRVAKTEDNSLSAEEKSAGWQLLFNGLDMSQWRNFKRDTLSDKWLVSNGEMQLSEQGAGDIITQKSYQNFDLRLEWKISNAGNSGVFIMADELGKHIYSHAVEVQILDNERHYDNKVDSHLSGSIYDLVASPIESHKPAGTWNQVRILLKNKLLKVWQNDVLVSEIVIGNERWQTKLANSKFKKWPGFALNDKGHIGLQDHGDKVSFKNIKIKEL